MTWGPKDPNDIANYQNDWTDLGTDTVASSTWIFEVAAGLVKDAESVVGNSAIIRLSGGTDGQTGILVNRIVTVSGQQFDSLPLSLPIVQTYPTAAVVTGYNPPTPAYLVMMYPAFAAVPPPTIAAYIVQANRAVDTSWTEGDYATAIMLMACHLMVQSGLGTGTEAQVAANGLLGYKRIKSGQLDLERAGKADSGASKVPDEYAGTTYGQQYWYLLLKNRRGPRVAVGDLAIGGFYPTIPPYWPPYQ